MDRADLENSSKPAPATLLSDRRASVRQPRDANTSCHVPFVRGEPTWPARICDISVGGVGLVVGRWFGEGTLLEVEFTEANRLTPGRYLVRVRHARPQPDGTWIIGGAFLRPLHEDDLQRFE